MKFEIAFDFENGSGQFPIDSGRLVIEGGEQEGDKRESKQMPSRCPNRAQKDRIF